MLLIWPFLSVTLFFEAFCLANHIFDGNHPICQWIPMVPNARGTVTEVWHVTSTLDVLPRPLRKLPSSERGEI
jgi:hypothetical protein